MITTIISILYFTFFATTTHHGAAAGGTTAARPGGGCSASAWLVGAWAARARAAGCWLAVRARGARGCVEETKSATGRTTRKTVATTAVATSTLYTQTRTAQRAVPLPCYPTYKITCLLTKGYKSVLRRDLGSIILGSAQLPGRATSYYFS